MAVEITCHATLASIRERAGVKFGKVHKQMKLGGFSLAAAGVAVIGFTGIAVSQEKGPETNVFAHRMNPHDGGAPTAGGTGSLTPIITNHHGPVLVTPTVYLIWYGNWNQGNGSDTGAGQGIVTDFLAALNGSPYLA